MRVKCNLCGETYRDPTVGAAHIASHDPVVRKPSANTPLFKVNWKKDGTIRQPRIKKEET